MKNFNKIKVRERRKKRIDTLLHEIKEYWTTRTEGYWEVNRKELEGMQKEACWRSREDKERIQILDVVISRNLTWNLEHPRKAYQEWHRVLKPDGVLLNFDANYGAQILLIILSFLKSMRIEK